MCNIAMGSVHAYNMKMHSVCTAVLALIVLQTEEQESCRWTADMKLR